MPKSRFNNRQKDIARLLVEKSQLRYDQLKRLNDALRARTLKNQKKEV